MSEDVEGYLLHKIKMKRAGGTDEIPGILLRTVAPAISDYVARLYIRLCNYGLF